MRERCPIIGFGQRLSECLTFSENGLAQLSVSVLVISPWSCRFPAALPEVLMKALMYGSEAAIPRFDHYSIIPNYFLQNAEGFLGSFGDKVNGWLSAL